MIVDPGSKQQIQPNTVISQKNHSGKATKTPNRLHPEDPQPSPEENTQQPNEEHWNGADAEKHAQGRQPLALPSAAQDANS